MRFLILYLFYTLFCKMSRGSWIFVEISVNFFLEKNIFTKNEKKFENPLDKTRKNVYNYIVKRFPTQFGVRNSLLAAERSLTDLRSYVHKEV